MSTNIKLLISLLLGAAIGALVMKKVSTPQIAQIDKKEITVETSNESVKANSLTPYAFTVPLKFDSAVKLVQCKQIEDLFKSKALYTVDDGTKKAVRSWVFEKELLTKLLGINNYTDTEEDVVGIRCYLGFNNNAAKGTVGYSLVCVPIDESLDVIRRNFDNRPNINAFPEALEYHMPCPKHCGTEKHVHDLSNPDNLKP